MAMKNNVRRLRESRDMTQEQLANVLGVKRATVAQWESGMAYPRMSTAIELVRFFGVSLDELMADARDKAHTGLTQDERELLLAYRQLDTCAREMALSAVKGMANASRADTSHVAEGIA